MLRIKKVKKDTKNKSHALCLSAVKEKENWGNKDCKEVI